MRRITASCLRLGIGLALVAVLTSPGRAEEGDSWIVVPAPAFRDVVRPLEEHRRAQGYRVVRVDVDPDAGGAAELRASIHAAARAAGAHATVLLVGAPGVQGEDASVVVPAFQGTIQRMRGQPTDNPYGSVDEDRRPEIAVGRLPASTKEEAQAMVAKTIAFERRDAPAPHPFHIGLIVGHPGGSSALEKRFASSFVRNEITPRFRDAHPRWQTRAIVHMDESPFSVPDDRLDAMTRELLRSRRLLTVFLGHSGPRGLWSLGHDFAVDEAWTAWPDDPSQGVLLSCGCYTCQLVGFGGLGYGVRSIQSARGHVAVVGAHQVSYGAMGKLAFGGLVPLLEAAEPSTRLGDWYLAMKHGLAQGKIGWLTFKLYDQADGSGGEVSLADQREEHLEMWMLLGDPALRLPLEPAGIHLEVEGEAAPGATLRLRGTLPASLGTGTVPVDITVERAFSTLPPDAPALPAGKGAARDAALLDRHARANDPVLLRKTVESKEGAFEADLVLPEQLPGKEIRVRATIRTTAQEQTEAIRIPLKPGSSPPR